MFVEQLLRCGLGDRVKLLGAKCYEDALLHDLRVVGGLHGVLSPAERPVVAHEATWHGDGAEPGEALDYHVVSVELVGLLDFRLGEPPHAGHLAVAIVDLRGPVARDRMSRLRPGDGGVGVRVHHTANTVAPGAVDDSMRWHVGRRAQAAPHDFAVEVADDERLRDGPADGQAHDALQERDLGAILSS